MDGDARTWSEIYHARLVHWVDQLAPEAPAPMRLAAHCQHIRRWTIPRENYPEGPVGYKKWRRELAAFHAQQASDILQAAGYGAQVTERVADFLQKKAFKRDPEVQLFEDAICLVFLENEYAEFATKHDEEKLVRILKKTWVKMSPAGHTHALELSKSLPEKAQDLIARALVP